MGIRHALLLLFAAFTAACPAQSLTLPPGRRIELVCQRTLSTQPHGGLFGLVGVKPLTRENTLMVFAVARDVFTEDGTLIIAKGSPATGTVVDSQVGGGFKPHAPRLAVTVERVLTVDGQFLPLRFTTRHEGKWARTFGRAETGAWVLRNSDNAVETIFAKPELNPAVHEFFDLIARGRVGDFLRNPARVLQLDYVARQSGLPHLVRFLQEGRFLEIAQLVVEIQSGNFLLRSFTDVRRWIEAFQLMDEAWKAGNELTSWLTGRIKAPQIIAPAGFPVEAIVSEAAPYMKLGNKFLEW
jgi:hypothetical protein